MILSECTSPKNHERIPWKNDGFLMERGKAKKWFLKFLSDFYPLKKAIIDPWTWTELPAILCHFIISTSRGSRVHWRITVLLANLFWWIPTVSSEIFFSVGLGLFGNMPNVCCCTEFCMPSFWLVEHLNI